MSSISTIAQNKLHISLTSATQKQLGDLQVQLASGKKSQTFTGIAEDVNSLLSLRSDLNRIDHFSKNIGVTKTRIRLIETNLSSILSSAQEFKSLLEKASIGDAQQLNDNLRIGQRARDNLRLVAEGLNAKDDSRYLFSGGVTDQRPVDFENPNYTSPNTPQTGNTIETTQDFGYYQGDNANLSVRASENFTLDYGVNANHPAFEKIIRVLDHFAQITQPNSYQFTDPVDDDTAPGPPSQRQNIQTSITELSDAIDDLRNIVTNVSIDFKTLDNIETKNKQFKLFTENNIADIENIDKAEVSSLFSTYANQLNISFASLARVQQLSLINFL